MIPQVSTEHTFIMNQDKHRKLISPPAAGPPPSCPALSSLSSTQLIAPPTPMLMLLLPTSSKTGPLQEPPQQTSMVSGITNSYPWLPFPPGSVNNSPCSTRKPFLSCGEERLKARLPGYGGSVMTLLSVLHYIRDLGLPERKSAR